MLGNLLSELLGNKVSEPVRNFLFFLMGYLSSTFSSRLPRPVFPCQVVSEKPPAVLVVMTINTQVLPVGAICRVIPVIAVLMMYRKKIPVLEIELSPAFGADQAVNLQGLFPVIGCVRILP
jgi:hypothetical protein